MRLDLRLCIPLLCSFSVSVGACTEGTDLVGANNPELRSGEGGKRALSEPTCRAPRYSSDCSQVDYFECGFESSCNGNVLEVSWHEHVFCGQDEEHEEIFDFTCTYPCAESCVPGEWQSPGAELVAASCDTAGTGGTGAGSGGDAHTSPATGGQGIGGVAGGRSGGTTNAGGGGGVDHNGEECVVPDYSEDCSLVPYFDCGVEVSCEDNTVKVSWHEHVNCEWETEEYTCSYPCSVSCDLTEDAMWPESGENLIALVCDGGGGT